MAYTGFDSGEFDVDCSCQQGISNLETVVDGEHYEGEMQKCEDCGKKIILYGEETTKTALNPENILEAKHKGMKQVRPFRISIDKIKLDMLAIIADHQSEYNKHWIWNKKDLETYHLFSNNEYYIGFIYACLSYDKPVLHSIFVHEDERNNGYATEMIEKWVEKFGNNTEFKVRDPNDKVRSILNSLDQNFEEV